MFHCILVESNGLFATLSSDYFFSFLKKIIIIDIINFFEEFIILGPRSRETTLSKRNERFFIDRKDAKQNETTSLSRFLFKKNWEKSWLMFMEFIELILGIISNDRIKLYAYKSKSNLKEINPIKSKSNLFRRIKYLLLKSNVY